MTPVSSVNNERPATTRLPLPSKARAAGPAGRVGLVQDCWAVTWVAVPPPAGTFQMAPWAASATKMAPVLSTASAIGTGAALLTEPSQSAVTRGGTHGVASGMSDSFRVVPRLASKAYTAAGDRAGRSSATPGAAARA